MRQNKVSPPRYPRRPLLCSPSALLPFQLLPCRNQCAKEDLYYPHPLIQDVLWWTLYQAEPLLLGSRLRGAALRECMKHIHYEVRPAAGLAWAACLLAGWLAGRLACWLCLLDQIAALCANKPAFTSSHPCALCCVNPSAG